QSKRRRAAGELATRREARAAEHGRRCAAAGARGVGFDTVRGRMPHTTSPDGTRLYWETHGAGDPVLLIMGLGANAYDWHRTIPWLAERYRVIAFDNRGAGRSDVPSGGYTIAQMADDTAAVLDAAGLDTAHVVGASLGGMIAQRLALAHPRRLRSLVL